MCELQFLRNEYESDLLSNEHCLSSSENKAWKNSGFTRFEPMTSTMSVQSSTNWELVIMLVRNKLVNWWINDCEFNWKSYMWTASNF